MEIKYNIEKDRRKALAEKIGELAEFDVRYSGVPSCAYKDIIILHLASKVISANGYYFNGEFVVLKGSKMKPKCRESCRQSLQDSRN